MPVYENSQLKRADFFEANQRVGYTNYHFENGLLKTATLYFGEDGNYQPALEFNFSYSATGNISEMVTMVTGDVPGQLVRAQPEDKFVYEYQYNNNGLPKNAVVTQGLPGQPTVTSNPAFIYQ